MRGFFLRCRRTALLGALAALMFPTGAPAATIYVLTADKRIVRYDSATPGVPTADHQITGIAPSADVKALDCRPATGQLYLFTTEGSVGRLYALDPLSGAASLLATVSASLNGIAFGFDFDPVTDRIRLVSNFEENFRIDPVSGTATTDSTLSYSPGDPGVGANPCLEGAAFAPTGGRTTKLYGIDTSTNTLVALGAPDDGLMQTIGPLGVDAAYDFAGFDIAADGTAYAAFAVVGAFTSALYTVNLSTGDATSLGTLGGVTTEAPVVGMSVACGGTTHATLRDLEATRTRKGVRVRWRTAAEVDTLGFHVYRERGGKRLRLTRALLPAQGFGPTPGGTYSFLDRRPGPPGTRYWLETVSLDGSRNWLGPAAAHR